MFIWGSFYIIHIPKKSEPLMAVMTLIFMIKMQECATVYFYLIMAII